ncbi:prolipoprotein diacylglyceryl transferase [Longimicrobium sp.]|uniref:prolipoprotein diacylglyceryl transferase n=1 Tax=Longimicrobium sp. TaxID=2029185 RepID=UPI002BC6EA74|nr:prolipoprotein diacylglyceryl transferase [Longimicrobium sp.]HSU17890.1 prolipoprotein diacylglyceryl transferase [Longimicrobium sp.]
MLPVLFRIGGFTVTSFGVMMALSFVTGGWILARELRRRGQDPEHAWDLAGYAAIFGIVGAKIYYMILHWPETAAHPWASLLSRSGLVWYGGFILAALAVLFRVHRLKLPVLTLADACAPTLAIGYAIGRVGCFLVGDDYGGPTKLPWGVAFPNGAPPSTAGNLRAFGVNIPANVPDGMVMTVHPTQLYETALSLAIFFVVWKLRDRLRTPGAVWFVWLALAGVERFVVEIFRAKDDRLLGMFSVAQLISVLIVLAGVAGYFAVTRRAVRHPAAAPAGA